MYIAFIFVQSQGPDTLKFFLSNKSFSNFFELKALILCVHTIIIWCKNALFVTFTACNIICDL